MGKNLDISFSLQYKLQRHYKTRCNFMKWGSFGPVHITSLVIAALLVVALYFALKKASRRVQIAVLGVLSFAGICAVIFDMVTWNSPIEYLPLHLCSLNALVLPFAVFTRNKALNNLLLVWSLGAIAALVVNTAQAEYELMSKVFFFYFFPHVTEFGIPILMFKLGLVKKDIRCIGSTMGITLGTYTVIHFINLWLNAYCIENQIVDWAGNIVQVNYMYSLVPVNPVFQLFWSVIPQPYWYMLMAFPLIFVYLLIVYSGQLRELIRSWKHKEVKE